MSRAPDPLALHPVPRWLAATLGEAVVSAAAWSAGPSVRVRVEVPSGPVLVELVARGDRVKARRAPLDGDPAWATIAIDGAAAPRIAAFVRRVRWLAGADAPPDASPEERLAEEALRALEALRGSELGSESGSDPEPGSTSDTETDAVAVTDAAPVSDAASGTEPRSVAEPGSGGAAASTPLTERLRGSSDPMLRAVGVYLDLAAGRWDRVRDAAPSTSWLGVVLAGLRGDPEALRAAAEGPFEGADAVVVAAFCEASGWPEGALGWREVAFEDAGTGSADLALAIGASARRLGRDAHARGWLRRAAVIGAEDDRVLERAADELTLAGAIDDARAVLEERALRPPVSPGLMVALAERWLDVGRPDEARSALPDPDPGEPAERARRRGLLAALEGRWEDAAEAFEEASRADPADRAVRTWRAEVAWRLGRLDDAESALEGARAVAQNPVHAVLRAGLGDAPSRRGDPSLPPLLDALDAPREPFLSDDPAALREGVAALLDRFVGRREAPILLRDREGAVVRVVSLPEDDGQLSSRDASAETLRLIHALPLVEVEARFEALAERYPASPHPLCYRGELDLWLGELDRAIARFEEANERRPARWAYVGHAAALLLRGEHEGAEAQLAECARRFPPVFAATTRVYAGEAARRRGRLDEAIEELSLAVKAKPSRVGAWMNLALARAARGEDDAARQIFHRVVERVPVLILDALADLDAPRAWPPSPALLTPLFERCLEMMRGNRSSHLVTYFVGDRLRVARDGPRWREVAARHAPHLARALEGRVAAGALTKEPPALDRR